MAGSVNKVIIIGNLGQDPEIKAFDNGGEVANLNVATSETWKDKTTGERRERTEWHRVTIFNPGLIGVAKNYLRKGSKVYIEGQLETRKWKDKDGNDRYSTEVAMRPYRSELTMLDSRNSGNSDNSNEGAAGNKADAGDQGNQQSTPAYDMDDEIPF